MNTFQVLADKQLRLILVFTDKELETRLTQTMKYYMKTNAFLVIGEKWFWKKLRYLLSVNPQGADRVVGREFTLLKVYENENENEDVHYENENEDVDEIFEI